MRIRYTRRALGDLRSIYSYIAVDNPKAARAVESVIRETTDMLADFPDLGVQAARSSEFRGIKAGRYPYRIYYRVRGGEVWIVHVRHMARRPWEEDR
jgi:addiction module RelE/StbE family toxin